MTAVQIEWQIVKSSSPRVFLRGLCGLYLGLTLLSISVHNLWEKRTRQHNYQ